MDNKIRVTNTQPRLLVVGELALIPGGNNVDPDVLKRVLQNPGHAKSWQAWIDLGFIDVATAAQSKVLTRQPQGPQSPVNLMDRPVELAVALVEIEEDPKNVRRWKSDHRPEVKAACEARLAVLSGAK